MEPDSTFEGCDFFLTKGTITSKGGNLMDLIKIGKYIAGKRKELGMTQKQLAEKLGMSDKSVSKWERGVCLPDVSVYSDLCLILFPQPPLYHYPFLRSPAYLPIIMYCSSVSGDSACC